MFEQDLKGNLYKIWNRMSSGSYCPPPVRLVEIPKDNGGVRPLGIPTVGDRVVRAPVHAGQDSGIMADTIPVR
jgi:retron-type reverse transcriptase